MCVDSALSLECRLLHIDNARRFYVYTRLSSGASWVRDRRYRTYYLEGMLSGGSGPVWCADITGAVIARIIAQREPRGW